MIWSNCFVYAFWQWIKSPRTVKVNFVRNKHGRWHCTWVENHVFTYEFYAKGRSSLPYHKNLWYQGKKKRVSSCL